MRSGPGDPNIDMARFRRGARDLRSSIRRGRSRSCSSGRIARMEHGIVQMSNPRYFGLFNPGREFPRAVRRPRSPALSIRSSRAQPPRPSRSRSRMHVIRAVAQRAGFQAQASGHFATGGSEANYTALLCALTAAHPAIRAGRRARLRRAAGLLHLARLSHRLAQDRASGRRRTRRTAPGCDRRPGRMDPRALEQAIARRPLLRRGPVMIVATAGTTGGGMIDPLAASAEHREARGAVVPRRCGLGGRRARIRPDARPARRPRARRLDHHRCP